MPNRAPDFKFIYTNALGLQFSDNDLRLLFAIVEGDGAESAYEQMGVSMTHRTAKLMGHMLTEIIASYEAKAGITIPLDAEKVTSVRAVIEGANQISPTG